MFIGLLNLLKNHKNCSLQEMADFFKIDISIIKVQLEYLEEKGCVKNIKEM